MSVFNYVFVHPKDLIQSIPSKLWGLVKAFWIHLLINICKYWACGGCFCRCAKRNTSLLFLYNSSNWVRLSCVTGLEIHDPEEVEYIRSRVTATVGGSVTLDCGSTLPNIFIWGFTKPGTSNNVAVAYNYGQGPKLQPQSSSIGRMQVTANASALFIEELQRSAEGTFTCQALYDTDEGARITFYFTRLDLEDNW